jgi:predicted ATP-binding protein involved in virulence
LERIELFKDLINEHFKYTLKTFSIDKKTGFRIFTHGKEVLSPTALSSGEQHELVLMYQLLFKIKKGSLILIDEPELSLHVSWQQTFLKDLSRLARLTEIEFLLATHSPQIIHDRWDLTVALKGPES